MLQLFRTLHTVVTLTILSTYCGHVYNGCSQKLNYGEMQFNVSDRVDGGWSSWSSWSQCSYHCIFRLATADTPKQTRTRDCTSPSPAKGGKYCAGYRKDFKDCYKGLPYCPAPIHGRWSEWEEWSICPSTCFKTAGPSVDQYRRRHCQFGPINGGRPCVGKSFELLPCHHLPPCNTDGAWSEWITNKCVSTIRYQKCAKGYDIQLRSCDNPSPHNGADCAGPSRRVVECWILRGCPGEIQQPKNITHSISGHTLLISWWRPPYGEILKHFNFSFEPMNSFGRRAEYMIPLKEPQLLGEYYDIRVTELQNGDVWYKYNVTSIGYHGNSASSSEYKINIEEVDGGWSNWTWAFMAECSSSCIKSQGKRMRRRFCNNPSPTVSGAPCPGESTDMHLCWGTQKCL